MKYFGEIMDFMAVRKGYGLVGCDIFIVLESYRRSLRTYSLWETSKIYIYVYSSCLLAGTSKVTP